MPTAFSPRRRLPALRRLAVGLVVGLVAATAQAAPWVTAQLFVSPSFAGGSGPVNLLQNDTVLAQLSGSGSGGANSAGSGSTSVKYGVIKLQGEFAGSGNTISRGIFRDDLTFNVPGLALGTPLDVTFAIDVSGDLQVGLVTGLAQAQWNLQADLGGGATDLRAIGTLFNNGTGAAPTFSGDAFGSFQATVRLANGYAAPLYVQLEGAAQAAYNHTGARNAASYDLSHSLYWGGITQLSVNGQAVTDYALSSASGTDYRLSLAPPVPEPTSAALLFAGLGLVAWLKRGAAARRGG
ncbi:PEP-CTERM sorting domain-containing protein [Roseateles sp.]|uniref:PEP-CTERM sorting domain-containing protein n=1 Tax=Roseateles sp. TaxID=1971397 RepID=UPI00392B57E8